MDAAGEEVIEMASSPCSMPPMEGPVPAELVDKALKPLWACWRALLAARNKREPLELDLPERRVMLDEKGRILSVAPRERLDAHRLVEDYMIAANVAAAKALERRRRRSCTASTRRRAARSWSRSRTISRPSRSSSRSAR